MTSLADVTSQLEDLERVRAGPKQVERKAEAIDRELARVELADALGDGEHWPAAAPAIPVGVDGAGISVHKVEVAGREGKQDNGSERTRELKLVVRFAAEARDEEGCPQRDRYSATYSGAIDCAASDPFAPEPLDFAQRVWREASWRSVFGAQWRAGSSDEPEWIWNLAYEHFPRGIKIVDLFHAKPRI